MDAGRRSTQRGRVEVGRVRLRGVVGDGDVSVDVLNRAVILLMLNGKVTVEREGLLLDIGTLQSMTPPEWEGCEMVIFNPVLMRYFYDRMVRGTD